MGTEGQDLYGPLPGGKPRTHSGSRSCPQQHGAPTIPRSPTDDTTKRFVAFASALPARYVKIKPLTWHAYMTLRADVLFTKYEKTLSVWFTTDNTFAETLGSPLSVELSTAVSDAQNFEGIHFDNTYGGVWAL